MSKAFRLAAAGLLLALAACSSPPAAAPVPAASSPSPSAGAAVPTSQAPVDPRIPQFPPAPVPVKVTLPPGPRAKIFSRIPTDQKIAFITMDDGWTKDPHALQLLQDAHVPVTLFLEINAIKSDPGFFTPLQGAGATIEAHTISHPDLKGKSYAFQKQQICGGADQLREYYGKRPTLFRPPFGDYDDNTLKAVHDCGMKAAFYWMETTDKGKVRYAAGSGVKPGDIILMHFRPAFVADFLAVLNAIHKAGLTPARLEDYIP